MIATAVFLALRAEAEEGQAGHGTAASVGDSAANIDQKLNNPISSLINVPLQNNFDFGGGPRDEGFQYRLNVQPVIPFALGDDWNLITRTRAGVRLAF